MAPCPICADALVWRHNGAWCDRCHRKVETCCEGAPEPVSGRADPVRRWGGRTLEIPHGD